ncbi:hypothetical protein U9M48_030997 [Paspalum notatum var. saurae]|uniref:Uncharacterized protein n=1 Tax=Paspalum notatum var. saurae TaxID=547442 RepID=A0AAQ3U4U6_PASNO
MLITSNLLSQGGKLILVNSVLSAFPTFIGSTMKLHKTVVKQLDKYRRHMLWRGADLNSKKMSKAAWELVCLPNEQGGLGVIDHLKVHNLPPSQKLAQVLQQRKPPLGEPDLDFILSEFHPSWIRDQSRGPAPPVT